MSDSTSKPPNLYHLLGLNPLESDPATIATALGRLQKRLDPTSELKAEDRTRGQRILALGQKYLLDAKNKAAYDHQWRMAYQPMPVAVQAATQVATQATLTAAIETTHEKPREAMSAWDMASLETLLPAGDPHAPFDMASFLQTSEIRDPLAAEADLLKLISILSQAEPSAAPESSASAFEPPAMSLSDSPVAVSAVAPVRSTRGVRAVPVSGNISRRWHQQKQRSILIGGVSLVAGVGGLVLLGMYLSQSSPSSASLASAKPQASTPTSVVSTPNVADEAVDVSGGIASDAKNEENANPTATSSDRRRPRGRRSGLPQPGETKGEPTLPLEIVVTPEQASTTPQPTMEPASPTAAMPTGAMPASSAPAVVVPTEPAPDAAKATPDAPAAQSPLTADEKAAWKEGMTQARQSLSKLDVPKAQSQLKTLSDTIKTAQQRTQWQRLSEIADFIKDIREAMVAAMAGMSGGESFKLGKSTVVGFIEGDENKIVVRLSGTRRAFPLADMPIAMGVALVDLKMDVAHANSLARKGAYILLHPKNDVMAESGKAMLAEAAKAGAISAELARFYEDDYALTGF